MALLLLLFRYGENGANDELYDGMPNGNNADLANGYQDVAGVGAYEGDEPMYVTPHSTPRQ